MNMGRQQLASKDWRVRFAEAGAFSLLELLMVVSGIAVLSSLMLPTVAKAKSSAKSAVCLGQLRQLGLAAQMYWDDYDGRSFSYMRGRFEGGVDYWFGWIGAGREGERPFDRSRGLLWQYGGLGGLNVCPSFDFGHPRYKAKANGASFGYGYNLHLSSSKLGPVLASEELTVTSLAAPSSIVLFADAAQVNDFQSPASLARPMYEEFYYVNASSGGYPNAHFRHGDRSQYVAVDGHVETAVLEPATLDRRLPFARIGRLPASLLNVDSRP